LSAALAIDQDRTGPVRIARAALTGRPAVHVSWHEAQAYCEWQDGRLPTFDEWRLAA
jgi:formylglycine-generating enzyme required for sulfatase activity